MMPYVWLTDENIYEVAQKTGRRVDDLISLLAQYKKRNVYPVKIPLKSKKAREFYG